MIPKRLALTVIIEFGRNKYQEDWQPVDCSKTFKNNFRIQGIRKSDRLQS